MRTTYRDKATRGPGDGDGVVSFSASPCLPVFSSPCLSARRRRRRAFTLPEVLAALILIGIVLPPVLKGISLAMGACDDAKRKIEATGLAESKLADLTVDAVQLVSSGGGSGNFPDHPDYTWDAQTLTQDTDLSEITVRVAWTARGSQRSIELSTLIYTGTTGTSSSAASSSTPTGGGGR